MNPATQTPDELFPQPVPETGSPLPPPAGGDADADTDAARLMPYEKAAKAIFVKANGLPAYTRAMRSVCHAD
jgi:hypothetical protein